MTRFARAIGSKSSNKKVPEDATPWNQLKQSSKPYIPKKIAWKKQECSISETPSSGNLPGNRKINEYKRRKPLTNIPPLVKDGQEICIVRFEGFPVRKRDAERLKELKSKLLSSKIPLSELKNTMKLERRRAEKALAREKKKLCFNCRNSGHVISECPSLGNGSERLLEAGICFKCGSTEHQHIQCKVVRGDVYKCAICFICKEEGHISKQCPYNPRGLYPEGGSCRICGDVTHLKKDCPKFRKHKKEEFDITVKTLNGEALDALDEDLRPLTTPLETKKKKNIVRM